ncbi:diguanylate cyclase [[Enterobacter] lignolyticus]|uniref:diguanylate cyclase n=1 Tax=Enterobacter lignolyticus (strain SCF1) TaxID=701347 RepID=E3G9S7_ENTLS|nr:diguanylate cyclase [[Enterobacter] lignolyticus]ADO48780.1 diguanylate cyclase [[Enterobacter] lignolyticus SCF1]
MKNELVKIDAVIESLNQSLHAHYKWLVDVFRYVSVNDRDVPEITAISSHDLCQFGRWVNKTLQEHPEDKGLLLAIHLHHEETHRVCRELVASIVAKDVKLKLFDTFHAALQGLIESIYQYRRHLLQIRTSYDTLTGLPLRRILDESFDAQLSDESDGKLYILLLDIDHFKRINDTWGHLVGDGVLRAFAEKLRASTRSYEPVYRYGGEEFIVILKAHSQHEACRTGLRITQAIADYQIHVEPHEIRITVTCGLTPVQQGEPLHRALERADAAMYMGKQSGRNRCMFIDEDLRVVTVGEKKPARGGQIILEAM